MGEISLKKLKLYFKARAQPQHVPMQSILELPIDCIPKTSSEDFSYEITIHLYSCTGHHIFRITRL